MNPNNLKKSLLNYAIEGNLSAKFRREKPNLNALEELETYNQKIQLLKSQREQWKKNLEKLEKKTADSAKKQRIKSLLTKLKKRISTYQSITPITDDEEIPFEIPKSWAWVRLNNIQQEIINPSEKIPTTLFQKMGKYPIVSQEQNLVSGYTDQENPITEVPLIAFGDHTCIVKYIDFPFFRGADGVKLLKFKPCLETHYMYFFLQSLNISTDKYTRHFKFLKGSLVPLPPIEEQRFISGEIGRLLSYTQDFEFKAQRLQTLENNLASFMDKSLLNYAIEGNLSAKFRREKPNLNALEELETYNQKIQLLKSQREQWKKNLEKLEKKTADSAKKQRIKSLLTKLKKRISTYQSITPITDDEEIPFEIPKSWAWVRLGKVGIWKSGTTPPREKAHYYNNGTIPWLKTGDLNDGNIFNTNELITQQALNECNLSLIPQESVLIAMYGATIGKLGITKIPLTTNQACCACKCKSFITPLFLFYFLMQNKNNFIALSFGSGQSNISKEKIENSLVPLPPIEEQRFISGEIERLLTLCAQIKET